MKKAIVLTLLCASCASKPSVIQNESAPARGVSSVSGEIDYSRQFPPSDPNAYPHYPLRTDIGEVLQPGEKEDVAKSTDAAEREIHKRLDKKKQIGRADHSTSHGCYAASVQVDADIKDARLARGIASPKYQGQSFSGIARLSNAEPSDTPDLRAASMGFALKIFLESGPSHAAELRDSDFLMGPENPGLREQDFLSGINPAFMAKDIKDYSEIFSARVDPTLTDFVKIGTKHTKALIVDRFIKPMSRGVDEAPLFLQKRFWSTHPYAWGDSGAKFSFMPCHKRPLVKPGEDAKKPRYQQSLIEDHLREADICYQLVVQLRPNEIDPALGARNAELVNKHFPIEDAKVVWPYEESKKTKVKAQGREVSVHSPYRPVATVKIAQGTPALPPDQCEKTVYNPWNGLKDHQPLGSLGRARLSVYKKSKEIRYKIYQAE